jgi:aspartyl-tRNA(Asn)/glutamyl-tRNA(Gln) amidotransferase subunit A
MKSSEYAAMTAVEMAHLVRQRELSPVELVRAAIDSIGATDARLNAWCDVFEDAALAQAKELEAQAVRGEFKGVLHGVPVGIKDLFLTRGLRTRRGSKLYADWIPTETAPAVQRLLDAGGVMVGKNTTPETGWKASSTSPLYGVTRNPWDPSRTAGGSSSGSAVAVAAGNVPITLGSDGGGSMRIPASFCGIFSMKPSLGRVPAYPLSPSEHLSHAGPMTSTVADYALALDVIKGPDAKDPLSLPDDGQQYADHLDRPFSKIRVAVASTLFGKYVDSEVAACLASAFKTIARMPGVEVVEPVLDWVDPIDIFDKLWIARGALYLGTKAEDKAKMDPGLVRLIAAAGGIDLEGHLRSLQARARFCRQIWKSFEDFDLLLTPMIPIQPFAAEDDGPAGMDPTPAIPWARWTPFSYPFNITGQPAASVPCGWTSAGMPVGLQIVGQRFDDLAVLRFCAAWERSFNWLKRRPKVFFGS